MTVTVGTKLGPYEVLAPIGKGGMGEVWKARDTKLGRDVALKILPAAFASDPDRMARFEREARVLASLDHPNIAAIYGLEESNGIRALVLALIDGPTLADRIAAGPIPLDEAIQIARQIAEAVEYAHDRGVIHRDLKPANIKITSGGMVKVLDFGLAKALDDEPVAASGTNSPTLTMNATRAGVLLGTAAYMSPEQAKGKQADRRSDIWSFGVVLFELVTGKPPFSGETVGDTLASVIKEEVKLDGVPAELRSLGARCLNKDPRQRLQAIGEARIALENPTAATEPKSAITERNRPWKWIAAALVLAITAILGWLLAWREKRPAELVQRYTIAAPEKTTFLHSFAISPDGRVIAIAAEVNGKRQLWLRALDAFQAQPLPGTDDATYPFWSPDSRYIGFFARGKLKKVAVSGGPPQSLCDAPDGRGGSWNRNDVIVFSPNSSAGGGIQRVPAGGGVPTNITGAKGAYYHPVFLPDGRHFTYLLIGVSAEQNGVYWSSLDGRENRRVLPDASTVVSAAGRLLFVRENTLVAQPFDGTKGQTVGDVLPVAEGVSSANDQFIAPATASQTGVLLYETGSPAANQLGWYDRAGKSLGSVGDPGQVWEPAISPGQKLVVFRRLTASGANLWLRDLTRGAEQRLTTTDAGFDNSPFWSPTGDQIVFRSTRNSNGNLYQKAASGSGQDELLFANENNKVPTQWSRDRRYIVYSELGRKTKWDLWVLPLERGSERKPVPFLRSEFNELFGRLSPDSKWMAYTSDESGQREVYVRPFPVGEGQWRISIAGGEQPRWRGDGKELFFYSADGKMVAVAVKAIAGDKPVFEAGAPQSLFAAHLAPSYDGSLFEYDVTADGKRFLLDTVAVSSSASVPQLNVVVNWDVGVKR